MENINVDQELRIAKRNSAKPMLWIAMISMVMFFAGLTSAYVISMNREDWVTFELPNAAYISTVLIILSSLSIILSQRFLKNNKRKASKILLVITLILGFAFVYYQYEAFLQLQSQGFYFTGKESTVSSSLLIIISFMHVLHVIGGIITLIVLIYNHFKEKYIPTDYLGFELGAIFWHFVDVLWIYLFFFFYFIR